jgi:hypothetical protein
MGVVTVIVCMVSDDEGKHGEPRPPSQLASPDRYRLRSKV